MADLGIIFLRRKHTIHWYQSLFTIITGSMPFRYFGPPCIELKVTFLADDANYEVKWLQAFLWNQT